LDLRTIMTILRFCLAAVSAAVVVMVGLGAATATKRIPGEPTADSFDAAAALMTDLRYAYDLCSAGDLADDDHTLIIDVGGEAYGSGDDIVDGLACVLDALDTPQSVISQMESTRALDGMQTAEWDDFEASWTYHPDDGVDVIITLAS
jgi:hypothetical protein